MPDERRRPTARLTEPDGYGLVLILLVTVFFLMALGQDERWLRPVITALLVLTLHFGLHTARAGRPAQIVGWVLGAVAMVVVLVQSISGEGEGRAASYIAMGLLLVMSPYFILKRILGHDRVTVQTLLGAVCVYVILGLTFAFVYGALVAIEGPDSIIGGPQNAETMLYFSFVTMTTVGYGDVTAATDLIRTVAILEALAGQVFLVTLVARLVSLFGQPMRHLPPEDG
jgi:hypothetical protein